MEFIFEILFEFAVRTPGYFILRMFRSASDVKFEDHTPALAGILFWALVGLAIWAAFHFTA